MDRTERPGEGKLILVVDDHMDFALSMQQLLAGLGFDVAIAANGFEALAFLRREKVHVILTDLFMPQMDGLELLRQLRSSPRPMPPAIAVTGDTHRAAFTVGSAAASLGAKSVLIKPFSSAQLAAAISFATLPGDSAPAST